MLEITLWLILASKIQEMGHEDFRTRQAATDQLRSLDEIAIPLLKIVAVRHDDPEIRHRAIGLLNDWLASVRPSNYPVLPWIDMMPKDFPDREEVLYKHLLSVPWLEGDAIPNEWPRYRIATYLLILDMMEAGKPKKEIVRILDDMVKIEYEYCKANGYKSADGKVNGR